MTDPKNGSPVERYRPGQLAQDRKTRFDRLLAFVRERNGWITSVPGAETVTVEVLPDSALPDELRDAGYTLEPIGAGERIIGGTITERLTLSSCGIFEPLTPESTKAVAEIRRHSGIVRTKRYSFALL